MQLSNSGVIPEEIYTGDNPVRQLAKEILKGRKKPFSQEEIESIVDQRYFGFDSLVSLDEYEKLHLRDEIVNRLLYRLNEGTLRKFLETDCYWSALRDRRGFQIIYTKEALLNENVSNVCLMTAEEKLMFLKDPRNLKVRWRERGLESDFATMGYRNIDEYGMPGRKSFTDVIREIQTDSGRKELNILDLGGGVGLALRDAKKIHPELVTYNATRDEEFSHYPVDFHIIGFMERMPLVLKDKINFIFSNMTTRYLSYTDLVLRCCVMMLAKKGIMNIFFSSDSSNNRCGEDIKRRMKLAYVYLKDLEKLGLIKLKINNTFSSNFGGTFRSESESLYPAATVFVKKL